MDDSTMVDFLSWGRDTTISDLSSGEWVTHDYSDPITIRIPMFTRYEPSFTIQLPEAYILMPQYQNVIELLDLHGVQYKRPFAQAIQCYKGEDKKIGD